MRNILRFVVSICILGAVFAGGMWAHAQRVEPQEPMVISGDDLGVRVDDWNDESLVGALVVRVDGQWVEVEFPAPPIGMKPLTRR